MRIRGQLFLLKIGDGQEPETFTTVAGQRSGSSTLSQQPVDVSSKDGSRWKQLLEGGVRGLKLQARGLINDAASYQLLHSLASQGVTRNYQITFGNGFAFTGPFQIETWAAEGEYRDSQQYDLTLVGADDVSLLQDNELLLIEGGDPLLLTEGGDALLLVEA